MVAEGGVVPKGMVAEGGVAPKGVAARAEKSKPVGPIENWHYSVENTLRVDSRLDSCAKYDLAPWKQEELLSIRRKRAQAPTLSNAYIYLYKKETKSSGECMYAPVIREPGAVCLDHFSSHGRP